MPLDWSRREKKGQLATGGPCRKVPRRPGLRPPLRVGRGGEGRGGGAGSSRTATYKKKTICILCIEGAYIPNASRTPYEKWPHPPINQPCLHPHASSSSPWPRSSWPAAPAPKPASEWPVFRFLRRLSPAAKPSRHFSRVAQPPIYRARVPGGGRAGAPACRASHAHGTPHVGVLAGRGGSLLRLCWLAGAWLYLVAPHGEHKCWDADGPSPLLSCPPALFWRAASRAPATTETKSAPQTVIAPAAIALASPRRAVSTQRAAKPAAGQASCPRARGAAPARCCLPTAAATLPRLCARAQPPVNCGGPTWNPSTARACPLPSARTVARPRVDVGPGVCARAHAPPRSSIKCSADTDCTSSKNCGGATFTGACVCV